MINKTHITVPHVSYNNRYENNSEISVNQKSVRMDSNTGNTGVSSSRSLCITNPAYELCALLNIITFVYTHQKSIASTVKSVYT